MKPKVDTHERVRQLQPCEERERQRELERRKDVRAVTIGYLANPSRGELTPARCADYARQIAAMADAMGRELEREPVKG